MEGRSSICEAPIQHFLRKRRLDLFVLLSVLLFEQKETRLFFHDKKSPQTIFAFMLFLKVLIELDDVLDDNVLSLLFLELFLCEYGLLLVPKPILRNRQPSLQLVLHIEQLGRTFSSKTSPRIDQPHFSGGYRMKRVFSC
jgi:hypothetical protein